MEGHTEKGMKTGTWKLYYKSGQLKKMSEYKDDKANGKESFWFENGKLEKTGNYRDGKTEDDMNGTMKAESLRRFVPIQTMRWTARHVSSMRMEGLP